MCNKTRISLIISSVLITGFLFIKIATQLGVITETEFTKLLEMCLFGLSLPSFIMIVKKYTTKSKEYEYISDYLTRLGNTLVEQSQDHLFYTGDIEKCSKQLTKSSSIALNSGRCSIWLYNESKNSIICEQLYIRDKDDWNTDMELKKEDFLPYFQELENNPIIIANDTNEHPATICFKEVYTTPLGIKSMLDVPIIYRGEIIGVVCVESLESRIWMEAEINFAHSIASLYAFAYSVFENNLVTKDLIEIEKFIDHAALISKTNKKGEIIYANKKFTKVSGYTIEEVLGKDHRLLNSGLHNKNFWSNMYKMVVDEKKIWNSVVTNKGKKGNLYYVDTYIKADFDQETGELKGFTSIRQDVTDIIESLNEVDKKNTYLEHAAKILRHDMHSGINTYIPRGITSLERRLSPEIIKEFKLEIPLKMLKEGLKHTQKVYTGVYDFTNLVKKDSILEKNSYNLGRILTSFLESTAYSNQVLISEWMPTIDVNESLFCTAIDNLIRNGLKYNDSETKIVAVYMDSEEWISIQDNGRGLSQKDFEELSKPYARKKGQKESGTGLGLNICVAILEEHGFLITCEKTKDGGTKIRIKIK